MKLPNFRRILFNDYEPEYRKLVERLSITINNGFESLNNAMNKNVSLGDNVRCDIKDIVVEVNENGFPKKEIAINSTLAGSPVFIGSHVILSQNLTNSAIYPTSGVQCNFTQSARGIIINHITGLPANYQFLLRVVFYA